MHFNQSESMVLPKRSGPPFLFLGSDEEGRKPRGGISTEWTPKAVGILLDSYAQKFSVGRGYLTKKDWEEVVNNVNTRCEGSMTLKRMKQCRDKVDSLKRRYKMEKRKAVNGSSVTWPFFKKLDEMMSSVLKQGRGMELLDRHQKSSLIECNHVDQEEEKLECSGSPEECAVDSTRYDVPSREFLLDNKPGAEEVDGLSEDGLRPQSYRHPTKLFSYTGTQSTDNSSEQGKTLRLPDISGKGPPKKRKMDSSDPLQALAHAVTGFSEVFARVELAKLEIFTKMRLELAKLECTKGRKKRHRKDSSPSSSSSTSSG